MTLNPAKILSFSSAEEFLSEIEPSIMRPKNLIGLEWMEGIGDGTSGWIDAFETEKGVVFIDLPLTMTIERDLSALNSRPAQVRAVMHRESKVWAPDTLVDIRLRSSMKACSKGNVVLLVVQIKFKTTMLKSSLCDYSDAYILAKGTITVNKTAPAGAAAIKKVIFKNCAPFTNCISKINNTQIDNAKDIDIVMPMYNL